MDDFNINDMTFGPLPRESTEDQMKRLHESLTWIIENPVVVEAFKKYLFEQRPKFFDGEDELFTIE